MKNIVSAFLVLGLLRGKWEATFAGTVGFFASVGPTIGFVSHAWNWFGFSTSYVAVTILDLVVGWTLAGLAVATLARTRSEAPT